MSAMADFLIQLEEGLDFFRRDWEGMASREPVLDLSTGTIRVGMFTVQPVPCKDYRVKREIAYWKVSTKYMSWRRKTCAGAAKLMRTKW